MAKIKKKKMTLEDVRNMKFDGPLDEFDIILGLAAKGQRDRERIALEEEGSQEPLGQNLASIPPVDVSKKVGRVMREKTTPIKNPDGIAVGKKMKLMPRDITKEDTKHLERNHYTSAFDFNLLLDIGTVSRELYKEAAGELTKSQSETEEEEPSTEEEEFCCPIPEAAAKRKRQPRGIMAKKAKTTNNNNKVTWTGLDGGTYKSADDYKPELPEYFKGKIREVNGSDVKLVIQKQLTPTDLDSYQNRVSVPISMLSCKDFLTASEEEHLKQRKSGEEYLKQRKQIKGPVNGIKVLFIEPNGDRNEELVFKRWVMPKEKNNNGVVNVSTMYVINGNGKWKDVFQKHKLKAGMMVQLWSFRYDGGKLGFAMVIVGRALKTEANRKRDDNGHGSSGN